jgi:hypothetical protein
MAEKPTERKWAAVFIEIALRAIRRVHYEYGVWGLGRQWQMNRFKAARMNMGHGIDLADERTVCAAITQEFINSPSMTGFWIEEHGEKKQEERYFTVDREANYQRYPNKKVDIFIQKFAKQSKDKLEPDKLEPVELPAFIEAKRARLWTSDIPNGTVRSGDIQDKAIRKDIRKLRAEMKFRNRLGKTAIRCHLLIWGLTIYGEDQTPALGPEAFFKQFKLVTLHCHRWLPIKWTQDQSPPKVEEALWVGLAEVHSPIPVPKT